MDGKAALDPMVQRDRLQRLADAYLGKSDAQHPLASPLFADLQGLPPLLVHVGTAETLLDDSTRFAERARRADVDVTLDVWDDMIHVFHASDRSCRKHDRRSSASARSCNAAGHEEW